MSTIAVIKTGGKQYKVAQGDTIKVEKLPGDTGSETVFTEVLLIADTKTGDTKTGTPFIEGATVEGKVTEQARDKKIIVTKYKPKTRYKVRQGHRQPYSKVEITKISG